MTDLSPADCLKRGMGETERTVGVAWAAEYLSLNPDTVRARAKAGIIPAYKPGKEWVFLPSELLEYLKTTRPCSTVARTRKIGIADLRLAAKRLDARLGRPTARQRQNLKIISGSSHGGKSS